MAVTWRRSLVIAAAAAVGAPLRPGPSAWTVPGAAGGCVACRIRSATPPALVSILGAGRVVIPLDPAAPPAELSRVLAAGRLLAAVSGSGLRRPCP